MVGPIEHFNEDIFENDDDGIKQNFDLPEYLYTHDSIVADSSEQKNIHGKEPQTFLCPSENTYLWGSLFVAPQCTFEQLQSFVKSSAPSAKEIQPRKSSWFKPMQQQVLEQEFTARKYHPYLNPDEEFRIAQELNVGTDQVRRWFANRR